MTQPNSERDNSETLVLLGVVWRDHVPHVRVRRVGQAASELRPAAGWRLGYQIVGEPALVCLGHVPFRSKTNDYHDCVRRPRPGSRHCERCAIIEATFASNLHHAHHKGSAELDASVRDHLDQPNRLYLAAFRDGSIKIGTSTLSRSEKRLEEQGAWIARYVAETTNGRTVRHLEDAVTEYVGIGQAVSATRKLRGLVAPVPSEKLDAILEQAVDDVRSMALARSRRDGVTMMDERWRHPMTDHPAVTKVLAYPLPLDSGRHDLRVVTAVGRHLLVHRADGDDVFAVDPASLFGVRVQIGDFGSDEIAIQDALF